MSGNLNSAPHKRSFGAAVASTLALSIMVAGCGGRDAHPVAATTASDNQMGCASITREFDANERQVLASVKERSQAQGKNVVLGATGVLLFWPALFFMDPKSPEKVEIDALRNRNEVLKDVARSKGCSTPKSKLTQVYQQLDGKGSKPSAEAGRD